MKAVLHSSLPVADLLSPVLDRPLLRHIVEQLVRRGIDRIDLTFPDPDLDAIRNLLGDGSRWGIRIACHSVHFGELCDLKSTTAVLFGDAACLPALPATFPDAPASAIFFHDRDRMSRWTGWAILRERDIPEFANRVASGLDWRTVSRACGLYPEKVFLEGLPLSAGSPKQTLEANLTAVSGQFPGLYFDGREQQPGVWVARGARIPATAVLTAPCYIGEDAWLGEGCRIGPNAVVSPTCVVESGTIIANAVVTPGTYVGAELEITDSVVIHNTIHNVRLEASIEITEQHLISPLTAGPTAPVWVKRALSVLAGAAGILLAAAFVK